MKTTGYQGVFPTRLREWMDTTHTTQKELAAAVKKRPQTVSLWVLGETLPDIDSLAKIADYFKISADYLLGRTDDPKPKVSVIDDLGLPIGVCDMLLEHNTADSLQRRGLEALCETEAFFDLLEKVGILRETMGPYVPEFPEESDPYHFRKLLNRDGVSPEASRKELERARLQSLNFYISKNYPDVQKHGKFCYGQEYNDVLRHQIARLMEKALDSILEGNDNMA